MRWTEEGGGLVVFEEGTVAVGSVTFSVAHVVAVVVGVNRVQVVVRTYVM